MTGATPSTQQESHWWQEGVIYQVYPRSFADSNGDGIGDLQGIRSRLPYLKWLGVDAVWISPVFPSPMADFGYDVSDYTDIDPLFGTLEDFDELLEDAHSQGLRVILDFVPNHTSEAHPWFRESRASRTNARRGWYIWRDPAPGGGPPNNWMSNFGGPAWTWDEVTGQYYYHAFLPQQPDLNWRNAEVRDAMSDILRFWFKRDVDGFRIDVIWHLIKDSEFRDNPPNPDYVPSMRPHEQFEQVYNADRPEVHQVVEHLRSVSDEFPERVLIGEIYLPLDRLVRYYGSEGQGVHLPFNFHLLLTPWARARIQELIDRYESLLPAFAWPNWVLGNHDRSRVASRIGSEQARGAAMLLLTLRGTPTIYYGDEIGMKDVPIPPDKIQDPFENREPGRGFGRDPERTPMQWDASPNGGFTTGSPWLPPADDYRTINVETQAGDGRSMLTLVRRLLDLRKHPALKFGRHVPVSSEGEVLAFMRVLGDDAFLTALNMGPDPARLALPPMARRGDVAISTHLDREDALSEEIHLRPNEGIVARIRNSRTASY